jgi:hypothetical protein
MLFVSMVTIVDEGGALTCRSANTSVAPPIIMTAYFAVSKDTFRQD